jgi:hypothetical protein
MQFHHIFKIFILTQISCGGQNGLSCQKVRQKAVGPKRQCGRTGYFRIIGEKYLEGPPDLCIEVISKSSRKIDRGRKFVLYAEHGVKEYWIVDPLRFTIEFYENQDGEWVEIKPDEHGRLHSKVLSGFWLNAKWFTSVQPLPPVAQALEEILGKERKR